MIENLSISFWPGDIVEHLPSRAVFRIDAITIYENGDYRYYTSDSRVYSSSNLRLIQTRKENSELDK